MSLRPRRSALYMPASNARALEKAKQLDADAVVMDLEDAVSPEHKAEARMQAVAAVNGGGYGHRELVIRTNGLDTPWGEDDLIAVAQSSIAAVCLPKVESAEQVEAVVAALEAAGAPESLQIWPMIETPKGVLNVQAVAAASPRVSVLVMGTSDLAKELRVPPGVDRLGLLMSLSTCVLAARVNDLDVLDGVYLDLNDAEGFESCCRQGRELGFDGKTLIHPKQLLAANETFGPSAEDVARARKIIDAWREAEAAGEALVLVGGKLVEVLHEAEAQRVLTIAEAIEEAGTICS